MEAMTTGNQDGTPWAPRCVLGAPSAEEAQRAPLGLDLGGSP